MRLRDLAPKGKHGKRIEQVLIALGCLLMVTMFAIAFASPASQPEREEVWRVLAAIVGFLVAFVADMLGELKRALNSVTDLLLMILLVLWWISRKLNGLRNELSGLRKDLQHYEEREP